MTNQEIDRVISILNERSRDLTLESWELCQTGGNCQAIRLHSTLFEILLTEEGTLPDSIDGPWMVGIYRLDDKGDNVDDGDIIIEGATLDNALEAALKALNQQVMHHDRENEWYVIRCIVSGGVTGYNEAVAKDLQGRVIIFYTREAAEAKAAEWRANKRFSLASYRYVVEPFQKKSPRRCAACGCFISTPKSICWSSGEPHGEETS